ncbi:hypothetical protein AcV5_010144 [Taiwanofungus camphoratus]|nr:hypothetical protein AcV5_010144 [Antrodia cinnamomea]KAI0946100.1 hypothetical protein AcV7_010164 [Antrodia cinnamomea]
MKWGLVPHWSKHEDASLSTVNARSENLVDGVGMYTSIKGKKRCAVICQGYDLLSYLIPHLLQSFISYYEWLKKGKERLPHFTKRRDGHLMLLAGLYDRVVLEGESQPLWTFTIVTTAANKEFQWLHDRQPVILSSVAALNTWLDTSSQTWATELTKLVEPYNDPAAPLTCYQVPKEVGKVGTESPTFIQPIAQRKDGIQAMFAKQKEASSSKISPTKRKPSRSPPLAIDVPDEDNDSPDRKKPKVEKLNAWENESEIECIDDPKTEKNSATDPGRGSHEDQKLLRVTARKRPKCTSKMSTPKKQKQTQSESSTKITAFFGKP